MGNYKYSPPGRQAVDKDQQYPMLKCKIVHSNVQIIHHPPAYACCGWHFRVCVYASALAPGVGAVGVFVGAEQQGGRHRAVVLHPCQMERRGLKEDHHVLCPNQQRVKQPVINLARCCSD